MNKRAATFRLTPAALDMLRQMSAHKGISQADLLELAVRNLASRRGYLPQKSQAAGHDAQDKPVRGAQAGTQEQDDA